MQIPIEKYKENTEYAQRIWKTCAESLILFNQLLWLNCRELFVQLDGTRAQTTVKQNSVTAQRMYYLLNMACNIKHVLN